MQMNRRIETLEQPITLTEIVSAVSMLTALDKLRLIRIIAEELESTKGIFPFEPNKTYCLPTPYNSFGVADILAEAMEPHIKRRASERDAVSILDHPKSP